jgi:hypothetical protein
MKDPSRLLSQTGSLEADLLGALRDADPPAEARDEVWQRMGVATGAAAVGLAATAPLAARAAASAGTKALTQTGWLSVIKWVAVVGTLAPAASVGVHWIVSSRPSVSPQTAQPAPVPVLAVAPPSYPVAQVQEGPKTVQATPEVVAIPSPAVGNVRRGPPASNLDAESGLLRRAREKLENGDPKGTLDDIAVLTARFPRGELGQEREVLAIQALRAEGQRAAAASRTADFLRLHPSSPYAGSLRQALTP